MKTLEFKLSLNNKHSASIDRWLDVQRWTWNQGLACLKEFEAFAHYNKHDKSHAPCCPVPWEYRWQKGDNDQWIAIPYSTIKPFKKAGLCCPLPKTYREPRLDRDSEYSLTPLFAKKLHPDKPWYQECPYKLSQGTIKLLATSWAEYRKGKRKSPRFKRRGENRTLNDTQSGNAKASGGFIKLPGLGKLRVRSLEKRWPIGLKINSYRIMKRPSGYYLLLVGEVPCETPKPSEKACGFDAGLVHLLNDDAGHHIDIPLPLQRRLKALKRLQRKASRQVKGSANQKKTYASLARLHERIARDRKAWHHKLSTFAVRKYDAIAVEKLNLAGMGKRPKAKPKEDGTGYERNMATAKSGLNRKLRDAGIGQLYRLLEEKCKAFGRQFEKVPAAYTSQTCNACGAVDKASRQSQSEFVCVHCGHAANADTNAARNIRDIAFPDYRERYPALTGEFKPATACETQGQQEGERSPSRRDVAAIPKPSREPSGASGSKSHSFDLSERQNDRSAQTDIGIPIQLSFWGVDSETG
ncbi:MAG: type V CRISPR-associated protein C2c8 [Cyanobacteria bacterium P01_F01_bin.56]